MNSALLLIGSGCLVCLLPLALYLLFLSFLNSRRSPTLLSGTWDLFCLLLGLSGFILVGGPVLLSVFDSTWRGYILGGSAGRAPRGDAAVWSILAAVYLIGLAVGVSLLFRSRRRVTVVYNFAGADAEELVAAVLDRAGLAWRRSRTLFEINSRPASAEGAAAAEPTSLEVQTFPALRHVTLRWGQPDERLRRDVESDLVRALAHVTSPPNPAGGWFMTASVALFFVMLIWMAFLVFFMVRNPAA